MAFAEQLEFDLIDLTPVETKMKYIEKWIENVEKKSEKVRRGLFSRHNDLAKMIMKQQQEIDYLKSLITNDKNNFFQLIG